MNISVSIDAALIKQVIAVSHSRTRKEAISTAMREYIRLEKRQELKAMVGRYEKFGLTIGDLRKMR